MQFSLHHIGQSAHGDNGCTTSARMTRSECGGVFHILSYVFDIPLLSICTSALRLFLCYTSISVSSLTAHSHLHSSGYNALIPIDIRPFFVAPLQLDHLLAYTLLFASLRIEQFI